MQDLCYCRRQLVDFQEKPLSSSLGRLKSAQVENMVQAERFSDFKEAGWGNERGQEAGRI